MEAVGRCRGTWDHGPLILLYRHALELRLKELIDAGNPFLPAPVDAITLMQTRSLRWLAQLVCQIIRAVQWEDEFVCDGVANLKDFSALIAEADALEPVSTIVTHGRGRPSRATVLEFARKTTALLHRLDMTASALFATWTLQEENPTVH